jgi:undecaprenyl-diphosphatase
MGLFEALFLGVIQGLTEFLPISSSAHLRIIGEFLPNGGDPGAAFTAITQIGTETAVVVYFWRDIVRIIKSWSLSLIGRMPRNDPDAKMGWLIIIGSLPIVVLGLLFQDQIETTFRSLWIVAIMLIAFGLLLGIADYVGKKTKNLQQLTVGSGLIFGFAQALALIPGVSRSGGTITAGLFQQYLVAGSIN